MTDGLGDPILGVEPHALATIHKLAPRAAPLSLLIGYGVFLLGNAGMNAPLYT
jgi:hypothetical protein